MKTRANILISSPAVYVSMGALNEILSTNFLSAGTCSILAEMPR